MSEIHVLVGTRVSPNPRGSNTGDSGARRRLPNGGTAEMDTAVTQVQGPRRGKTPTSCFGGCIADLCGEDDCTEVLGFQILPPLARLVLI